MINMAGGRPPKYETPEELEALAEKYFIECDAKEEPYTVTGLALALDLTREGFVHYKGKPEFADSIRRLKQRVESRIEKILLSGSSATGAIFNLKNNYKWRDEKSTEITGKDGGPITFATKEQRDAAVRNFANRDNTTE